MQARTFAVIGAGGGGQAMAGYLAVKKHAVNLFNRSAGRIAPVHRAGGIVLEGQVQGFGPLKVVSTDLGRVVRGVDVVMVVVPANAHGPVARMAAPHLEDGQIIVLNPGRTGGALEFSHVLRRERPGLEVIVAEAQTFIFASRITRPATVRIHGFKRVVPVAALPATHTFKAWEALHGVFPQFTPAGSVLATGLENIGAVFHPAPILLNAARIEALGGDFDYYHEGITPAVAAVIEAIDHERLMVARVLGVEVKSALAWLDVAYGARGPTLLEAIRAAHGYRGIKAPDTIDHRYIFEDIPGSLVPLAALGDALGVVTDTIKSIIHLASVIHGVNYWARGRTLERLGLAGLGREEILDLVYGGEPEEMAG